MIPVHAGTAENWDALNLECCANLEKLTLMFDFYAADEMPWTRDAVIHAALQLYTRFLLYGPRRLREVLFCIYGAANAELAFTRSAAAHEGRELWGALDSALAGLPALTAVKFLLCDVDDGEELEDCKADVAKFMGEHMPMAGERGLFCLRSEREEYTD